MKYVQHDFAGNIAKLQQAGEHDKVRKLIMDEIGQLLVYHRGHVVAALNEAGFAVDAKASDKKLSEVMEEALKKSDAFRGAVSTLLVGLNKGDAFYQATGCPVGKYQDYFGAKKSAGQMHNAGGYGGGIGAGGGRGAGALGAIGAGASGGPVGAIASALGTIVGNAQQNQLNQSQADIERLKLAQQILDAKNRQQPPATSSAWLWWILGIGAAVGIGVVIYKKTRTHSIAA